MALRDGDWASHNLEHSLSMLHPGVAHGGGLGVLIPAWIRYVKDSNPGQFARWAREVWGVGSVEEGRAKLTVMQADLDRLDTEIEDGVKALMKKMEKAA